MGLLQKLGMNIHFKKRVTSYGRFIFRIVSDVMFFEKGIGSLLVDFYVCFFLTIKFSCDTDGNYLNHPVSCGHAQEDNQGITFSSPCP